MSEEIKVPKTIEVVDELLKRARAEERERCARLVDYFFGAGTVCAEQIRRSKT